MREYVALQRFQPYVERGNFLPARLGVEVVDTCEANDLMVLGIEGFLFDGGYVVPQMKLIGDFSPQSPNISWRADRRASNEWARDFASPLVGRHELFLDFVVTCEDDLRALDRERKSKQ